MPDAAARQMPAPPEGTQHRDGSATARRAARVRSLTGAQASRSFRLASALALAWYFSSYFFPLQLSLAGREVVANAGAGAYLIPLFGLYRYRKEADPCQRRRILWVVGLYLLLWVVIPGLLGYREVVPQLDARARVFPAIHYVESLGFFLFFVPIFFFGRRADCGWCCPCVASRETFGAAFRNRTLKAEGWWRLRYLKYAHTAAVLLYLGAVLTLPATAREVYGEPLYAYLLGGYYLSFLLVPWTGNRNFCRWGCPWAGVWGILGYLGFYRLRADPERCTQCGLCEKVCDMGIPVRRYIQEKGAVHTPECMGCRRCVEVCPEGALEIRDVRDRFRGFRREPATGGEIPPGPAAEGQG